MRGIKLENRGKLFLCIRKSLQLEFEKAVKCRQGLVKQDPFPFPQER